MEFAHNVKFSKVFTILASGQRDPGAAELGPKILQLVISAPPSLGYIFRYGKLTDICEMPVSIGGRLHESIFLFGCSCFLNDPRAPNRT